MKKRLRELGTAAFLAGALAGGKANEVQAKTPDKPVGVEDRLEGEKINALPFAEVKHERQLEKLMGDEELGPVFEAGELVSSESFYVKYMHTEEGEIDESRLALVAPMSKDYAAGSDCFVIDVNPEEFAELSLYLDLGGGRRVLPDLTLGGVLQIAEQEPEYLEWNQYKYGADVVSIHGNVEVNPDADSIENNESFIVVGKIAKIEEQTSGEGYRKTTDFIITVSSDDGKNYEFVQGVKPRYEKGNIELSYEETPQVGDRVEIIATSRESGLLVNMIIPLEFSRDHQQEYEQKLEEIDEKINNVREKIKKKKYSEARSLYISLPERRFVTESQAREIEEMLQEFPEDEKPAVLNISLDLLEKVENVDLTTMNNQELYDFLKDAFENLEFPVKEIKDVIGVPDLTGENRLPNFGRILERSSLSDYQKKELYVIAYENLFAKMEAGNFQVFDYPISDLFTESVKVYLENEELTAEEAIKILDRLLGVLVENENIGEKDIQNVIKLISSSLSNIASVFEADIKTEQARKKLSEIQKIALILRDGTDSGYVTSDLRDLAYALNELIDTE